VAGQGLRDVTRIAGGDSVLWTDILGSNAAAVADILSELALDLHTVLGALRDLGSGDPQARHRAGAELGAALVRGTRGHARIPAQKTAEQKTAEQKTAEHRTAEHKNAGWQLSGATAQA